MLSIHDLAPSDIIKAEYDGKQAFFYLLETDPRLKAAYGIRLTSKLKHDK